MALIQVSSIADLETNIGTAQIGDEIELLASGSPYTLSQTLQINKQLTIFGVDYDSVKINLPLNTAINVTAEGVIIRGLHIEGVHPNTAKPNTGDPNTVGVVINSSNCIVEFCRINAFSYAAIDFKESEGGIVRYCYLHNNRQAGLGYGVVMNEASFATIYSNTFELNRHHIAASGEDNQGYEAYDNLFGTPAFPEQHSVDVHGLPGVTSRGVRIYNNNFVSPTFIDIVIRGNTENLSTIFENNFNKPCARQAIRQTVEGVVIGQNEVTNLNITGNFFNGDVVGVTNLDNRVLVVEDGFEAKLNLYGSECLEKIYTKTAGVGFDFDIIIPGNWFKGDKDDLFVKTRANKFYLIKNENQGFTGTEIIELSDNLKLYDKFYTGKITSTDTQLVASRGNDIYVIDIAQNGTLTETNTLTLTEPFEDLVCGYFSNTTDMDIFGYRSSGETILYRNTSGTLDGGTVLGTFPGHSGFIAEDFIGNGFWHVCSYLEPNFYLFRFNTGTLLNGAPTIRSGSGAISYKDFKVMKVNGAPSLICVNNNNDLDVLEYGGSSFNIVNPVGWLNDYQKFVTGNF